ncbi:hypothetical protein BH10PSE19_BH10PSE19_20430 [soil metagenome]
MLLAIKMRHHLHFYKQGLEAFFDALEDKAFSEFTLKKVLNSTHDLYPNTTTEKRVVEYLIKYSFLKKTSFINPKNRNAFIYFWREQSDYTIISGLRENVYYSHFSALFINELTLQIPKSVYLNHERSSQILPNKLYQSAIDAAFKEPQRKVSDFFKYKEYNVFILNGKHTNHLGVLRAPVELGNFYYTDIERTLIDITVRPNYAGGVFEVLSAFKLAKEKLNIDKLLTYIEQINFAYPYKQALGFYLEKSGYNENDLLKFGGSNEFKFYLTYNIKQPAYSERWNIVYPKGF